MVSDQGANQPPLVYSFLQPASILKGGKSNPQSGSTLNKKVRQKGTPFVISAI
jgi:hypothetical protein